MSRKVLLVDMKKGPDCALKDTFHSLGYEVVNGLSNFSAIDSQLKLDKDIQSVVINIESPSETVFNAIGSVSRQYTVPVIVFTDTSNTRYTEEAATIGISAYIVDGFEPGRLQHIMDLANARHKEVQAIKSELEKTRLSLAERKVIEKAKGILMRRRSIDEDVAFRLMRKMAMDKNLKLAEVARNIVHVDTLFT